MKKLLIIVAALVLVEFIALPIYCGKVLGDVKSPEAEVKELIVQLTQAQTENDLLREQVAALKKELAVIKLKNVRADIVKGKTKDKNSPLWFDVNILTPAEQVKKLDEYIKQLMK